TSQLYRSRIVVNGGIDVRWLVHREPVERQPKRVTRGSCDAAIAIPYDPDARTGSAIEPERSELLSPPRRLQLDGIAQQNACLGHDSRRRNVPAGRECEHDLVELEPAEVIVAPPEPDRPPVAIGAPRNRRDADRDAIALAVSPETGVDVALGRSLSADMEAKRVLVIQHVPIVAPAFGIEQHAPRTAMSGNGDDFV